VSSARRVSQATSGYDRVGTDHLDRCLEHKTPGHLPIGYQCLRPASGNAGRYPVIGARLDSTYRFIRFARNDSMSGPGPTSWPRPDPHTSPHRSNVRGSSRGGRAAGHRFSRLYRHAVRLVVSVPGAGHGAVHHGFLWVARAGRVLAAMTLRSARFDDLRAGCAWAFPAVSCELAATRPEGVAAVLAQVDRATTHGWWAFRFVCYEAALGGSAPCGTWPMPGLPLAWFGICAAPEIVPVVRPANPGAYRVGGGPPSGGRAALATSRCRPGAHRRRRHLPVQPHQPHDRLGQR
jgi:hypothetical protein